MDTTNRRRFISGAIATAASYGRILGANDRIRIGAIGTGSRGQYLLSQLNKLAEHERHRRLSATSTNRAALEAKTQVRAADATRLRGPSRGARPQGYRRRRDRARPTTGTCRSRSTRCAPARTSTARSRSRTPSTKAQPLIAAVQESKRVVQTGTQQRSWEHYIAGQGDRRHGPARPGHLHPHVLVSEPHRQPGRGPPIRYCQARLEALPGLGVRPAVRRRSVRQLALVLGFRRRRDDRSVRPLGGRGALVSWTTTCRRAPPPPA